MGLSTGRCPNNDRASDYYKRAIEAALRKSNHPEEMVMKTEADLHTGKMVVICRPAHLPKVAAIRFEGNAAIAKPVAGCHGESGDWIRSTPSATSGASWNSTSGRSTMSWAV